MAIDAIVTVRVYLTNKEMNSSEDTSIIYQLLSDNPFLDI